MCVCVCVVVVGGGGVDGCCVFRGEYISKTRREARWVKSLNLRSISRMGEGISISRIFKRHRNVINSEIQNK
jgi:hypothetical protein